MYCIVLHIYANCKCECTSEVDLHIYYISFLSTADTIIESNDEYWVKSFLILFNNFEIYKNYNGKLSEYIANISQLICTEQPSLDISDIHSDKFLFNLE